MYSVSWNTRKCFTEFKFIFRYYFKKHLLYLPKYLDRQVWAE